MYALLFVGGVGQRLWPISRKNSPKQFSPLIGDKSSFQLAVERLNTIMPAENIYVSTNVRYEDLLKQQASMLPGANFILEPTRRDLAAAVALAFFTLYHRGIRGSILFQWGDNYIKNTPALLESIQVANTLIETDPQRLIFLGETPRFPNENLGWVELGPEQGTVNGNAYFGLKSWTYRPSLEDCQAMFETGNYLWNSGYFVSDIEFVVNQFQVLAPEITTIVEKIIAHQGSAREQQILNALYPTIPAIHFDHAFVERLDPQHILLLKSDLGWSDPGSLYALKEALQADAEANVTLGNVVAVETEDSLIVNEEPEKVVAVMGMHGVVVVNTDDALLVISKQAVRYIATLLDALEEAGYSEIL